MKVQLIVVQGKPEGKVIPLLGPTFKVGRGETCHLRPNSEQVSREHAEFTVTPEKVVLQDLGSRNGTLVNGKALTEPYTLKDRDLVQIGPLTFAVAIEDATVAVAKSAASAPPKVPAKAVSPDDVSHDEIESWLIADNANPTPERPSGVYGGDTITITAFKDAASPKPNIPPPAPAPVPASADAEDDEYERLPEGAGDSEEDAEEMSDEDDDTTEEAPEEFIDESNPFHVKKKAAAPEGPVKPSYKDSSDAASDILRKMMERKRGSK
jgi:predicted component of type VI protein secretion system